VVRNGNRACGERREMPKSGRGSSLEEGEGSCKEDWGGGGGAHERGIKPVTDVSRFWPQRVGA